MSSIRESILDEVEQLLADTGMAKSRFGINACGDHHTVDRLRNGRLGFTLKRLEAIQQQVAVERQKFEAAGAEPDGDEVDVECVEPSGRLIRF